MHNFCSKKNVCILAFVYFHEIASLVTKFQFRSRGRGGDQVKCVALLIIYAQNIINGHQLKNLKTKKKLFSIERTF